MAIQRPIHAAIHDLPSIKHFTVFQNVHLAYIASCKDKSSVICNLVLNFHRRKVMNSGVNGPFEWPLINRVEDELAAAICISIAKTDSA